MNKTDVTETYEATEFDLQVEELEKRISPNNVPYIDWYVLQDSVA